MSRKDEVWIEIIHDLSPASTRRQHQGRGSLGACSRHSQRQVVRARSITRDTWSSLQVSKLTHQHSCCRGVVRVASEEFVHVKNVLVHHGRLPRVVHATSDGRWWTPPGFAATPAVEFSIVEQSRSRDDRRQTARRVRSGFWAVMHKDLIDATPDQAAAISAQ